MLYVLLLKLRFIILLFLGGILIFNFLQFQRHSYFSAAVSPQGEPVDFHRIDPINRIDRQDVTGCWYQKNYPSEIVTKEIYVSLLQDSKNGIYESTKNIILSSIQINDRIFLFY